MKNLLTNKETNMDVQSLSNHIIHLQEVHDGLDKEIDKLYNSGGEDDLVKFLKKKKLKMKDEIEEFKRKVKILQ